MQLQQYKNYSPTTWDIKGLNIPDKQNWFVAPCGHNRDTADPAEISNWIIQEKILKDANCEYEIANFRHWACGWFEIMLVHPDNKKTVEEMTRQLDIYPLLDEDHVSEIECDLQSEAWENLEKQEFVNALEEKFDILLIDNEEMIYSLFHNAGERSNTYWESSNIGVTIDIDAIVESITLNDIQTLILKG